MRRLVGVLLLASLLVGGVSPQAWGQVDPQVGVTIGGTLATLESPDDDVGNRTTYVLGLLLRQQAVKPLSLQAELLLSQKGTEVEADGGGALQYGAGYLELPILVHVEAPPVKTVTLHAEAGGFGAVKLYEQQRSGSGSISIPFGVTESFFHRFDAGLTGGLGVSVPIGTRRLNLTIRHERGLVDVARTVEDQPFSSAPFPTEGQTRTWSLLLRLGL